MKVVFRKRAEGVRYSAKGLNGKASANSSVCPEDLGVVCVLALQYLKAGVATVEPTLQQLRHLHWHKTQQPMAMAESGPQ